MDIVQFFETQKRKGWLITKDSLYKFMVTLKGQPLEVTFGEQESPFFEQESV